MVSCAGLRVGHHDLVGPFQLRIFYNAMILNHPGLSQTIGSISLVPLKGIKPVQPLVFKGLPQCPLKWSGFGVWDAAGSNCGLDAVDVPRRKKAFRMQLSAAIPRPAVKAEPVLLCWHTGSRCLTLTGLICPREKQCYHGYAHHLYVEYYKTLAKPKVLASSRQCFMKELEYSLKLGSFLAQSIRNRFCCIPYYLSQQR